MKIVGGPFSEVPQANKKTGLFINKPVKWVISGRMAFKTVLNDIVKRTQKKSFWVPSFYCDSIIQEIRDMGFHIEYYDVFVSKDQGIHVDINIEIINGCILLMSYYGFSNLQLFSIAKKLKDKNVTIIEDVTHSLLNGKWIPDVDYYFGSIRKWTGVRTGGFYISNSIIRSENEVIYNPRLNLIYDSFIDDYTYYLKTGIGSRSYFGDCFWECELELKKTNLEYGMYKEDTVKISYWDFEYVKRKRFQNAAYIIDNIERKDLLIYKNVSYDDIPFFVPLYFENYLGWRDLCRVLDEHNIYCNISWKKEPDYHGVSNIIGRDFGLICDERYTICDMKRMIDLINAYL